MQSVNPIKKAWEMFKHFRAYHTFGGRWIGLASMSLSVLTAVGVWFVAFPLFTKLGIIFSVVIVANLLIAFLGYIDVRSGCLECEVDKTEKASPMWVMQKQNNDLVLFILKKMCDSLDIDFVEILKEYNNSKQK